MNNLPACMYFSSCSRLCSTSAGVSVKIFFGGNAGTTLLPYSFFICLDKTQDVKVKLRTNSLEQPAFLFLLTIKEKQIAQLIFFKSHLEHLWNQIYKFIGLNRLLSAQRSSILNWSVVDSFFYEVHSCCWSWDESQVYFKPRFND